MEIPQHLMQHVASQVIGGGGGRGGQGGGPAYPAAPDQGEQGYNAEYYQQYSQYWSQYAAWQQWQTQYSAWEQQQQNSGGPQPPAPPPPAEKTKVEDPFSLLTGPLNQLVEHTRSSKKTKGEAEEADWLGETEEMWESIEESRWWQPTN